MDAVLCARPAGGGAGTVGAPPGAAAPPHVPMGVPGVPAHQQPPDRRRPVRPARLQPLHLSWSERQRSQLPAGCSQ